MPKSDAPETFAKFKWTLIITFVGLGTSVLASFARTGTFDPEIFLMGLIGSLIVALITSRYEETKYNATIMTSTINELKATSESLRRLVCPIEVVPTTRALMYTEARKILEDLINQHERQDQVTLGALLLIQRTPSLMFHSDLQKHISGYKEEKDFISTLDRAITLAKRKKIRMVYAFSITDPSFLDEVKKLLRDDPAAHERIKKFASTFCTENDSDRYWDFLRLYPMEERSAHPLIVADNVMAIWLKETEDDRAYVRAVDETRAKEFFEKYWRLTSNIPPIKAKQLLLALG